MAGLNGIPVLYDQKNIYNSQVSPSTVHASNTTLSWFFYRYLMQKIFSVYDFQLPDEWDMDSKPTKAQGARAVIVNMPTTGALSGAKAGAAV